MLLSALLGTLGSVSLMAQSSTNVYSLNVVGYINVTVEPGYNIVSCPLIASPDNTLNTLLPNTNGFYKGWKVYFFSGGVYSQIEEGTKSGWLDGGTNTLNPGQAVFVQNTFTTNVTVTFVGTVPSGTITNILSPGFNLVGSVLPASGDLVTNSLTQLTNAVKGDRVYVNDPVNGYTIYTSAKGGAWTGGDPIVPNVGEGFFYQNNNGTTPLDWVESFSASNP